MVILLGGAIGVISLRFMAGLFIRWLEEFEHLEDAGFVTVAVVGVRLLVRVVNPELVPPEWLMVGVIALLFTWGFSKRVPPATADHTATHTAIDETEIAPATAPKTATPLDLPTFPKPANEATPAALVPDREDGPG